MDEQRLEEIQKAINKDNRCVFTEGFRKEVDELLRKHWLGFFTPNYDDYEFYYEEEDRRDTDIVWFVNATYDELHEEILEQEVIYYANAMEYLSHYDPSLKESLQLADDLWFDCKSLNSETLATILYQENCRYNAPKFLEELIDLF